MEQSNIDYIKYLRRKGGLEAAIETLEECFDKLDLIRELYDKFYNNTESFESEFSCDMLYLIGAVAKGKKYEVHPEDHELNFENEMTRHFPPGHEVWKHIVRRP